MGALDGAKYSLPSEWKPIMDVSGVSSMAVKGGCHIIAFINIEWELLKIKEVMPSDNRYHVVNPFTGETDIIQLNRADYGKDCESYVLIGGFV